MKEKISIAVLLLISALLLWAALPATDSFTDTDGTDLVTHGGGNWTANVGAMVINTNAAAPNQASTKNLLRWSADTPSDNQYTKVIRAATAVGCVMGFASRVSTSGANTAYFIYWYGASGYDFGKVVTGTTTVFGSSSQSGSSVPFEIRCINNLIIPFKNNALDTSVGGIQTDSAIASGTGGLKGDNACTISRADDFETGNVTLPRRRPPINSGNFTPDIPILDQRSIVGFLLAPFLFGSLNDLPSITPALQAQSTVPFRVYMMPMIEENNPEVGLRRIAKYYQTLAGLSWGSMASGSEDVALVGAYNVPDVVHASLVSHADCVAAPPDLNQQIGAQLANVQTTLEAINLPTHWVQSTFTYRQVIRVIASAFQFWQAYEAAGGGRLLQGATLDTRFNQLSAAQRAALQQAAQTLNYDTSSLSATSTIRQIWKAMADQWGQREVILSSYSL